jgi:hypothetical protein
MTKTLTHMQFLQRILPPLLVLGAVGILLSTFFSDHKADYGKVTLPAGGLVDLPEGGSTVYVGDIDIPVGSDIAQVGGSFAISVVPVDGGERPTLTPPGGDGRSLTRSSEGLANRGAVADIDAPQAGAYRVSGSLGNLSDVEFSFGRSSFAAVVAGWQLWGGLLLAAILIALLPKLRHRPTGEGWVRPDVDQGVSGGQATGEPAAASTAPPLSPYNG